jgi:hypothetical protein
MSTNACHLSISTAKVIQFYLFKIHYNIILPSIVRSSKRSPSLKFLHKNPKHILLSLICNIWPSNKIWWTVQITKHLFYNFLQSPPSSADSSSAPCPWMVSAYVLLSMWQTKSQTHTQEQANMVTLTRMILQLFISRCLKNSHFLYGIMYGDTLTFTMLILFRFCKYRQLSILKLQPSLNSQLPPLWFSSWLTTARWSPMGSRPMARQNRITCITGRAKMNSITLSQWYRITVSITFIKCVFHQFHARWQNSPNIPPHT